MPDSFKIEIQGLAELQKQLGGTLPKKLIDGLDKVMEKGARDIQRIGNQKKPTDTGFMQITVDSKPLDKNIAVTGNYGAFVEFGTGKYAAQYVATLPQDWQTYAAQFKGLSDGGTFHDLLLKILEWVKRQGIAGVYSVKSQRRVGNANQKSAEDYEAAYFIARSIIINGVHPHPFLYPAFEQVLPQLQADIQKVIDTFAV